MVPQCGSEASVSGKASKAGVSMRSSVPDDTGDQVHHGRCGEAQASGQVYLGHEGARSDTETEETGGGGGGVQLHFDTAYGVHTDGKSQTGSYVVIGDVEAVHCKSCKQNIVTKSSTEVELIAIYI